MILGNPSVITIIGIGGIGKTALALKVAYDILDMGSNCPFDAIIWVSAKTSVLTERGIESIHKALSDTGSVIEDISSSFITGVNGKVDEHISAIMEYLEVYNTLLVIDNLETIHNQKTRDFIKEASLRAKILITSRIGLGELEYRRELKELSESESVQLIRRLAAIKNSNDLNRISNPVWKEIAKKLHYNPLSLKWFINSIISGATPQQVLSNTDKLLEFCLNNVYNNLSDHSKIIIWVLLSSRSESLSNAEIIYLSNLDPMIVKDSLNELFATTLLSRDTKKKESNSEYKFSITLFAREYILKFHPPDGKFSKEILKRRTELKRTSTTIDHKAANNEFNVQSMLIRNMNEKVVAKELFDALRFSKNGNYDEALEKVQLAESIAPEYFEVYRVSAFIKANKDHLVSAEEDYKKALELEPENPKLLYFYAGFLLDKLEEIEEAKSVVDKLILINPDHCNPQFLCARCYIKTGNHEAAVNMLIKTLKNDNIYKIKSNFIIGYSILITCYGKFGQYLADIERDFEESVKQYMQAVNTFDEAVIGGYYDTKTIRSFVSNLYSMCKYIKHAHLDRDYEQRLFSVISENYERILRGSGDANILSYLSYEYGFIWSETLFPERLQEKEYGFLSIKNLDLRNATYVFVTSENYERLIAHRSNFLNIHNINEWVNLKDGQDVTFYLGTFRGEAVAEGIFVLSKN